MAGVAGNQTLDRLSDDLEPLEAEIVDDWTIPRSPTPAPPRPRDTGTGAATAHRLGLVLRDTAHLEMAQAIRIVSNVARLERWMR